MPTRSSLGINIYDSSVSQSGLSKILTHDGLSTPFIQTCLDESLTYGYLVFKTKGQSIQFRANRNNGTLEFRVYNATNGNMSNWKQL